MPTYQAVLSGQIDAESYLDTVLAGQWTNNLLAVITADPSAPKIVGLNDDSNIVPTPGNDFIIGAIQGQPIITSATYVQVPGVLIVVPRTGVYRVNFDLKNANSTGAGLGILRVDKGPGYSGPVDIGIGQFEGDANWKSTSQDLDFDAGDLLYLYGARNTGNTHIEFRNFSLRSATSLFGRA